MVEGGARTSVQSAAFAGWDLSPASGVVPGSVQESQPRACATQIQRREYL